MPVAAPGRRHLFSIVIPSLTLVALDRELGLRFQFLTADDRRGFADSAFSSGTSAWNFNGIRTLRF